MESFLKRLAAWWTPHPGQRRFLLARAPTKVLACGRRWGKTEACAVEILAKLVQSVRCRALVIAPTMDQARLVFDRLIELIESCGESLGLPRFVLRQHPYPHLVMEPHRVAARSAHRPRSLRGQEASHIVVDEAAFLPDRTIDEVLSPMLATNDGTLSLVSTPNGLNGFWRRFRLGESAEHDVFSLQAPSSENPRVRPDFLRVQRQLLSERSYGIEYEAEFLDVDGQVFAGEAIDAALCDDLGEPRGEYFVGIDWGRYGDYTAIVVVQGDRDQAWVLEADRFRGVGWEALVDRTTEILRRYPTAHVLCDATAAQDLAVDRLRERLPHHTIRGFGFSAATKSTLIERLASQFDRRALRMRPDPRLRDELAAFVARRSSSGHVRLAAAEGHDDLVIALALAVHDLPMSNAPRVLVGPFRRML